MIEWDSPIGVLCGVAIYFSALMLIAWRTGHNASNAQFFLASRRASWLVVAFGMIGATLSGITFTSIPGLVGSGKENRCFSYLLLVTGYVLGYAFIATVLLPLYYRLNLTSIYGYLGSRFGPWSFRTGSAMFLASQLLMSSLRLLLLVEVVHRFALAELGVPFWVSSIVSLALIWTYTFRGGIHTIVWTDLFQTACMLFAAGWTIWAVAQRLEGGWSDVSGVWSSESARVFLHHDFGSNAWHFAQAVISGALITIAMTGLDQDMMQKNLACRTLSQSRLNMMVFTALLVLVNLVFLWLGAVLYLTARQRGIDLPTDSDLVFPTIAFGHLLPGAGAIFLLGLIAATFSGADASLTALTTSTCVDFLGFTDHSDDRVHRHIRTAVHLSYALLTYAVMMVLHRWTGGQATILTLLSLVGLTYGPLLGLFAFGLFSTRRLREPLVPLICLAAPIGAFWLEASNFFCGVRLGSLLILVNAALTIAGLMAISRVNPAGLTHKL